jgi:hypothetical protein
MRHAPERTSPSATPLYDALCAEYRKAFRTLPGDRSGEEDLQFKSFAMLTDLAGCTCFGTGLHEMDPRRTGGPHQSGTPHQNAGFPGPRHEPRQLPPGTSPPEPGTSPGYGTHIGHGPHPVPGSPHQADPYGGHPPGVRHPVRKQHGYEALLPAVLPARPPGENTHR